MDMAEQLPISPSPISPLYHSPTIGKLMEALAAFQSELPVIPKNEINPHFRSRYADLPSIMEIVNPLLRRHKLVLLQWIANGGPGRAALVVRLYHLESDEWMECVASCDVGKHDAQGMGSAVTYLRRYSLCALGVITDVDDDGNGQMAGARYERPQGRDSQRVQQRDGRQRQPFDIDF